MGRIKTILIKRVGHRLMELHGREFTDNFEKNKELVNRLVSAPSKKLKNIIAGYVTRLVKKEKEPRKPGSGRSAENLDIYYK